MEAGEDGYLGPLRLFRNPTWPHHLIRSNIISGGACGRVSVPRISPTTSARPSDGEELDCEKLTSWYLRACDCTSIQQWVVFDVRPDNFSEDIGR